MKFPFYLLFLLMTISCTAQKKNIEMVTCAKGNTGFKGRVPKEDMHKPNTGTDFYAITLKVKKLSTIEIIDLTVMNNNQPVCLKATFDDGSTKMTLSAGETCYLRAEHDEKATSTKPIDGNGFLTIKVDGRTYKYEIKEFQSILPN